MSQPDAVPSRSTSMRGGRGRRLTAAEREQLRAEIAEMREMLADNVAVLRGLRTHYEARAELQRLRQEMHR